MAKKRKKRIWLYILATILVAIVCFVFYYNLVIRIQPPTELDPVAMGFERQENGDGSYSCEKGWLARNNYGLWEMYMEGNPLELGIVHGLLGEELVREQESAFVEQIKVMIPSESYLSFLKYFTAWFNKDLDTYIRQEYLLEIYGVSAFASNDFNFIGDNYDRILNYHAAHDIGHALQNLNLVKCTAFGLWNEKSCDSSLLIGRNFDFYVGDAFAENKIIAFVNPEEGYSFASISWGGMTGVVSGMNEEGLTVSLNSAKSDIPFGAHTPVSIIAREILQYASNIEQAFEIASKREAFVSESFLIGSASDHKAVVIEKSADTTILYDPDTNFIILTNHFQSEYFSGTRLNIENRKNETSVYRHGRVLEMIEQSESQDYLDAASILRDRKGKGDKNIGNGNEKAINQLIAHHSIIFDPEHLQFWISTAPWQLGTYLCYNLDSIFMGASIPGHAYIQDLNISPDTFILSDGYKGFINYRRLLQTFQQAIKKGQRLDREDDIISTFIGSNPEFFNVYATLGQYFQEMDMKEEAVKYYKLALEKEVASMNEREAIIERLGDCSNE